MSARSKLAGKLPGDRLINGLDEHAEDLVDRFKQRNPNNQAAVLIIGIARVRDFRTADEGDGLVEIPNYEITRLEPLGVLGRDATGGLGVASAEHQKILLQASENRTGETPLPIDAVSVQEAGIHVDMDDEG